MSLWLFAASAASLLFGAIGLMYWGLWGDRAKGRLRCPKCWYDMQGSFEAGKLECPECGKDAGVEKRLRKNHRRWWAMVVGTILILPAGYSGHIGRVMWIDQRVHQELNSSINISFEDLRFEKMIEQLGRQLNVEIDVDWQELESVGIEKNVPVQFVLKNVRGDLLLDLVLEQLSGGDLSWTVRDGRVIISRQEVLRE